MAGKKTDRASKRPKQTPSIKLPFKDELQDRKEKHEYSHDSSNRNECDCNFIQPFVVKIEKSKGWKRSEIISIVSAGLTLIAIALAFFSFDKTSKAVSISEKSYQTLITPYLQCKDILLDTVSQNGRFGIKYEIENASNAIAQLSMIKTAIRFTGSMPEYPFANIQAAENNSDSRGNYISKERSFTQSVFFDVTKVEHDGIMSGELRIYFMAEVDYTNPIDNSERRCNFTINISYPNIKDYKVFYNNNVNIKDGRFLNTKDLP